MGPHLPELDPHHAHDPQPSYLPVRVEREAVAIGKIGVASFFPGVSGKKEGTPLCPRFSDFLSVGLFPFHASPCS
jgi:hypothetical protein